MTDDSSKLVDMDDLEAFEKDFFNGKSVATDEPKEEPEVEDEEEEPENVDDADATEENADEDEEEEVQEEPKPTPKKKGSVQERINELTAKARESERREAELRRELEQLKLRKPEDDTKSEDKVQEQAKSNQPQPDTLDKDGNPVYPLGEFDPKFIRDLTRFTINEEREAAKLEDAEQTKLRQIELEQTALQTAWGEKVQEAEKELPDLREKLTDLTDTFQSLEPAYGEFLASTVMSCENGPQIMYYLSQNIGEAQKIVASGPAAATLALGRLDAKFNPSHEEKRSTKKVSAAPNPPEDRVRGSAGRFNVSPDTDDLDAFERAFFKK